MCKCDYCLGALAPLYQISTNGNPSYTLFEPAFCPKCGTPLGEVKPLTVEQLKEREGKPVWINYFVCSSDIVHWVIFWMVDFREEIEEYGETWSAYDFPPKE